MYLMNTIHKVFDVSENDIDFKILEKIQLNGIDYLIKTFYRINENDTEYNYYIDYLVTYINSYLKNDIYYNGLTKLINYKRKDVFNLTVFFIKTGIKCNIIDEIYKLCISEDNVEYILDILIYEPKFATYLIDTEIKNNKITNDYILEETFLGILINDTQINVLDYTRFFSENTSILDYIIFWLDKFYKINRFNNQYSNNIMGYKLIKSYLNVYDFSSHIFVDIHTDSICKNVNFDLGHIFNKKYPFDYSSRDSSIVSYNNMTKIEPNDPNEIYSPIILIHNKICEVTILCIIYKLIKFNDILSEYTRNYTNLNDIKLYVDTMRQTVDLYLMYFLNDNRLFIRNLFNFYRILGRYIYGIQTKNYSLYKYVPDNFIRNINNTILYISDINDRFKNVININKIVSVEISELQELIYKVMSSRLYCSNPYIRMNAIESLRFFVYINNFHYFVNFLDNLVSIYIDLEYFDTNNQYFEKFKYRTYVINILEKIISYNIDTNNFDKQIKIIDFTTKYLNNKKNNEKITKMLYMFMSDFNYLWEELIDKVNSDETYYDFDHYINNQFSKLDSYLSFLLKLFNYKNILGIIVSNRLIEKYIQSFNYNIKLLIDLDRNQFLKLNSDLKLHTIIRKIVNIYFILLNKSIDVSILISQDKRCYSEHFITDITNIYRLSLSAYGVIKPKYIVMFKIFDKVIKRIKKNYDNRISKLEFPEKYLDPLTFCEIINPKILPSSNMIIDEKTIFTHLLSHSNDPFNRQFLTLDILNEFNNQDDIKEKINAFLNNKNEWVSNNIKD